MIKLELTPNRAGDKRVVAWEGINSMSLKAGFANIVWIVEHLDDEGNLIEDPELNQGRRVITPISNENLVTPQGVLIIPENFESVESYEAALEKGLPEFTFWLGAIASAPLPEILAQAAQILANFNRFDKP